MRHLLCVALLCAVGCSSIPATSSLNTAAPASESEQGLRQWIPGIFEDAWEVVDARIGMDYGFGAHFKFTDLARVGIFDYAEFDVLGFDKGIFHGKYSLPSMDPMNPAKNSSWDVSAKLAIGLGAEATVHAWELVDLASSIVGFGYWSLNQD